MYTDPGDTPSQTPVGYDRYLGGGRVLDLVAQYHSRSGDIEGYCAFIERLIDDHGEHLATLQVGEEPNITGDPLLDGAYPGSPTRSSPESVPPRTRPGAVGTRA
jgi:hypothetical protein